MLGATVCAHSPAVLVDILYLLTPSRLMLVRQVLISSDVRMGHIVLGVDL